MNGTCFSGATSFQHGPGPLAASGYHSQWVSLQIRLRTFRPRTELSACPVVVVLKKSSVNGEVVELS